MSEFKKIYLQPECCVNDQDVGRMWCQDAINDCEEGNKWTEYLLASDVNQRIDELNAKVFALEKNLIARRDHVKYLCLEIERLNLPNPPEGMKVTQ
jgi:hypothetical protein